MWLVIVAVVVGKLHFFSGYFICVSFLGFFVFGFIFLWVLIL